MRISLDWLKKVMPGAIEIAYEDSTLRKITVKDKKGIPIAQLWGEEEAQCVAEKEKILMCEFDSLELSMMITLISIEEAYDQQTRRIHAARG